MRAKPRLNFLWFGLFLWIAAMAWIVSAPIWSQTAKEKQVHRSAIVFEGHQIDGDTIRLKELDGMDVLATDGGNFALKVKLRFRGIDTPEGYPQAEHYCPVMSRRATKLLWSLLTRNRSKDGQIRLVLKNAGIDTFGRVLADAYLPGHKLSISETMLKIGQRRGIVRPYFPGASKQPWPVCY